MRSQRSRLRRAGLTVMIVAAMIAVAPAPAAHAHHRKRQQELQRLIEQRRAAIARAEAKERDIVARIGASDRRRDELQRTLDSISGRLRAAQDELALATARLDRATAELAGATTELEVTLGDLEHKRDALDSRAASLYMLTPAPIIGAFQAARSLRDVIDAEVFSDSVVRQDAVVAAAVADAARRVEAQRARIERTREGLAADRAVIARETSAIAQTRVEQASATSAVQREINHKRGLLSDVRDQIAAHERAIASYKRESDSIAAFLRGRQQGQTATQGRGGYMKWPISGRVSSGYGYRTHPISGRRAFHAGIDIAAPHGTTIDAARAGEVVYAGYRGAYGLIVILDHGDGIATLYAHTSRTFVREGQVVGTGEAIAAVGTTGYSTGPHLHFEVRSNGEPTDPMRWL